MKQKQEKLETKMKWMLLSETATEGLLDSRTIARYEL